METQRKERDGRRGEQETPVQVQIDDLVLEGALVVPEDAHGVVLFAHGSGSSRHSPRNRAVARSLNEAGLATLLFDLLTTREEQEDLVTAHLRFDMPLLARRVAGAAEWLRHHDATRGLAVGAFGASTGGGAALIAAAVHPETIRAVVSRGGRPDLAGEALPRVEAPTLLIVGSRDVPVIQMNEEAMEKMGQAEVRLDLVEGATHLFEEPGALDEVADLAADWFRTHLGDKPSPESETAVARRDRKAGAEVYRGPQEIAALVADAAEPFESIDDADLDALLDRIGDAEVVLFGEASHGTSEFYRMRQRITRRLIEEKGFTIVTAEADWPDAERVDEYVHGRTARGERPWEAFARFPTWMWRNHDVLGFVEWLREQNDDRPAREQVGFYGLDLYSLYTSVHEVLEYLEDRDPDLADIGRARYSCLSPFEADPALYGRAVVTDRYRGCEDEAVAMLQDLLKQRMEHSAAGDGRLLFDATQNAKVVRDAERYYRTMFYGSPSSWNLRDTHMFETLEAVRAFRDGAKAVVWAHNSHVGNAEATQMSARGEINIGHLCREEYGDAAYLIGFGTHTGTVAAASDWGDPVEIKRVRPSHAESYERLCHDSGVARFLLPLRDADEVLRYELSHPRLERAIGVIYRPETELQSHYFHADLPRQFDEWIWFDESTAVRPLERARAPELPQRHPFRLLID